MNASTIGIGSLQLKMWAIHNEWRQILVVLLLPVLFIANAGVVSTPWISMYNCTYQWFMEFSRIDEDIECDDDAMRPAKPMIKTLLLPMMMTMMLVGLAKRTQNREWLASATSTLFIELLIIIFRQIPSSATKIGQQCARELCECDCVQYICTKWYDGIYVQTTIHRTTCVPCRLPRLVFVVLQFVHSITVNTWRRRNQKKKISANIAFHFRVVHMRSNYRCSFITTCGTQGVGKWTMLHRDSETKFWFALRIARTTADLGMLSMVHKT